MAVYIFLFFMTFIFSFVLKISKCADIKKKYLKLIFVFTGIIFSLRNVSVGTDTLQFCSAYIKIGQLGWEQIYNVGYELGFTTLCKLLNYVSNDYQLLLIVYGCFISFSFGKFIYKNSDDVVTGTLVFFCMLFAHSLNLMRQYFAIGIILLGLEYLNKKKDIKFLFFVFIASSFHYSAIICIIYIILYKFVISKKTLLLLPFISAIFIAVNIYYLNILNFFLRFSVFERYSNYIGSIYDVVDIETRLPKIMMVTFVLIFAKLTIKEKNKNNEELQYNFNINMILMWGVIETLAINMHIFSRLISYFDFMSIILISKSLHSVKNKRLNILFKMIVYLALILYFYVTRIKNNSTGILPYKFFWEI